MKSIVENKIILNSRTYYYIITYKKQKNIYFRVKDDLKIYVSAPKLVSQKYIEDLLRKEEKSIIKMYNQQLNRLNEKEELFYLGNKLILKEYDGKPYISEDYIYAKDEIVAKEYIYSLAYNVFNERLNKVMINFNNLPEFRLRVRKMKTKWGVCNIKSMTVTLNTELITKDVNLIDYVIVHELCHFKHMDHSASFWREVSKYYPYYKEARRQLNH